MRNIYNAIINYELDTLIKSIEAFDVTSEGHVKGIFVEGILRDMLRKFIPNNIEISNGWIVDENSNRSDERDILVYDRNKAPTFLFERGVGFIPLISLIYDIQIKCSLSEKIIKEAINKFNERTPLNVLLSIKGKNLLENYIKIDSNACINPKIKVLSSEEDFYYFWRIRSYKYSDLFKENLYNTLEKSMNIKNLRLTKNITINNVNIDSLDNKYIKIYEWVRSKRNHNLEGFIISFLNTLYKTPVSNYILNEEDKFLGYIVTRVVCDDEGNILYEDKNFDKGIERINFNFTCSLENGKIIISVKK